MAGDFERLKASLEDRYAIEREIGRGGMAVVYLADDLKHGRRVALKVVPPELVQSIGTDRFLSEIQITARLDHPHILPLLDSGEADGFLFFVMPFVEGETLRDRLNRDSNLPVDEALTLTREVASALQYAHERDVVHRDIKPGNIMLQSGHARLADFGIAHAVGEAGGDRLTATGMSVGTPSYMSPEQATGDSNVDARSDIYSLACVVYEMLAGDPPFTGTSTRAVLAKHLHETPATVTVPCPDAGPEVASALAKALEKEPEYRQTSAEEFSADLERGAEARRRPSRMRRFAGMAALVALVAAWYFLGPTRGNAPADEASFASIAVMPFIDLSPSGDDSHISEALAVDLIGSLGQADLRQAGVRVKGRASSSHYADLDLGTEALGDSLNVDLIIEGSFRRDGDLVTVTVQGLSADDGFQVFSATFEGSWDEIFDLKEELVGAVVMELAPELAGSAAVLAGNRTTSLDVYEHYLTAQREMYTLSVEGINKSIEEYQAAIAIDSMYAPAWAGLAVAYDLLEFYTDFSFEEAEPLIDEAANRALALDNQLWESHYAMGVANDPLTGIWESPVDAAVAESAYLRAIELAPSETMPLIRLADMLGRRVEPERREEALELLDRAYALDPANYSWWNVKAHFTGDGKPGRSEEDVQSFLTHTREMAKRFPKYPEAHNQLGKAVSNAADEEEDPDVELELRHEAIDAFRTAIALDPNSPVRWYFLAWELTGIDDYEGALQAIIRKRELGGGGNYSLYAIVYAGLGMHEEALAWADSQVAKLWNRVDTLALRAMRAQFLVPVGRRDEALQVALDIEAVRRSDPDAPRWHREGAWAAGASLDNLWAVLGDSLRPTP